MKAAGSDEVERKVYMKRKTETKFSRSKRGKTRRTGRGVVQTGVRGSRLLVLLSGLSLQLHNHLYVELSLQRAVHAC